MQLLFELLALLIVFEKVNAFDSTLQNGVYMEVYHSFSFNNFARRTDIVDWKWKVNPYEIRFYNKFESFYQLAGKDYLARFMTYFYPPQAGDYKFHIICRGKCELRTTYYSCLDETKTSQKYVEEPMTFDDPVGVTEKIYLSKNRLCLELFHKGSKNQNNSVALGVTYPNGTQNFPMSGADIFVVPDLLRKKKVIGKYYKGDFNSFTELNTTANNQDSPDFATTLKKFDVDDRRAFLSSNFGAVFSTFLSVNASYEYRFKFKKCDNSNCKLFIDNAEKSPFNSVMHFKPSSNGWKKLEVKQFNNGKDKMQLELKINNGGYQILENSISTKMMSYEKINKVTMQALSSTMMKVTWHAPVIPHGFTLASVQLFFKEKGTSAYTTVNKTTVEQTHNFNNLKEYKRYVATARYVGMEYTILNREQEALTLQDEPSAPPSPMSLTVLSSTEISVQWGLLPEDDKNGIITGFVISYAEVARNGVTITGVWQNKQVNGGNKQSETVSGLKFWTFYAFKVAAKTSIGAGPFTVAQIIRTNEDAPTMAPINLQGYNISETAVNISWGHVNIDGRNGIVRKYVLKYYKNGQQATANTVDIIGSDTLTTIVNGLDWFLEYKFEISAFTVAQGVYSASITVKTDEWVPQAPPPNVRGNNISDTAIRMQYDSIANPVLMYGYAIRSLVHYERVDMLSENGFIHGTLNEATLTGREPYTFYSIKVAIMTRRGEGNFSAPVVIRTDEGVPTGPPLHIRASTPASTKLVFSWGKIDFPLRKGIIKTYNVTWRLNDTQVNEVGPWKYKIVNETDQNTVSLEVNDLEMYRFYDYKIAGMTKRGVGVFSDTFSFRTYEDIPTGTPQNLTISMVKSDTLNVTWNPVPLADRRGIITLYKIDFYDNTLPEKEWQSQYASGHSSLLVVRNLKFFTNYSFIIAAGTKIGLANFTLTEVMNATGEAPPVVYPGNFTCVNTSSRSIACQWDKVPEGHGFSNGIVIGYHLFYRIVDCLKAELSNCNSSKEWMIDITDAVLNTEVLALEKFTNYSFDIRLYNSMESGYRSPPLYIYTEEDIPTAPPAKMETFSGKNDAIYVYWDPVPFGEKHGIIRGYTVHYRRMNEGPSSDLLREQLDQKRHLKHRRRRRSLHNGVEDVDFEVLDEYTLDVHAEEKNNIAPGQYLYPEQSVTVNASQSGVQIEGLADYQWYTLRLTSFTSKGKGPYTQMNQTCVQAVPSAGPKLQIFDKFSFNELRVNWSALPYSVSRGTVFDYNVVYYPVQRHGMDLSPYEQTRHSIWVEYPIHGLLIKELEPFVSYAFEVAALTWSGVGVYATAVFGETCRCKASYTLAYQELSPLISIDRATGAETGLMANLITDAVTFCCDSCTNSHGYTTVNHTIDASGNSSLKNNLEELNTALNEGTNIVFPIHSSTREMYFQFPYVAVVISPGVVVYSPKLDYVRLTTNMFVENMGLLWSFIAISALLALSSGMLMWIIQCHPLRFSRRNLEEFPDDLVHGGGAGAWWGMNTVLRLGSGDLVSRGTLGRWCAMPMMLIGLILTTTLMSGITVIFLSYCLDKTTTELYAQKVVVLNSSYDRHIVLKSGGMLAGYATSASGLLSVLSEGKVSRIAVDAVYASYHSQVFANDSTAVFRGVIEAESSYGVALAGDAIRLEQCIRGYLDDRRDIIAIKTAEIVEKSERIFVPDEVKMKVEALGTYQVKEWKMAVIVIGAMFCLAYLCGLIYECKRRSRNRIYIQGLIHKPCYRFYKNETEELVTQFTRNFSRKTNELEVKHAFQRLDLIRNLKKYTKYLTPDQVNKYRFM